MIDPTLPPTNELLLKCGPEGISRNDAGSIFIKLPPAGSIRMNHKNVFLLTGDLSLPTDIVLHAKRNKKRDYALAGRAGVLSFVTPVLGHVTTIGEVIDLYETLSQKKCPT